MSLYVSEVSFEDFGSTCLKFCVCSNLQFAPGGLSCSGLYDPDGYITNCLIDPEVTGLCGWSRDIRLAVGC